MRSWLILALLAFSVLSPGCFASHGWGPDLPAPRDSGPMGRDAGVRDASIRPPDAGRAPLDAGVVGRDAAPLECRPARVDEAHAPLAVAVGDPIPVLVRAHDGVSCGCTPRAIAGIGRESGPVARLEACDCSDLDPCVDSGYEATATFAGRPEPGTFLIGLEDGVARVDIVDPDRCSDTLNALSVRIVAPSEDLVGDRPEGYWAVITTEAWYCCAEPRLMVQTLDTTSPGAIGLALRDCIEGDCDCEPTRPTRWDHWHFLGRLPSGRHTVGVGGATTSFVVP